jgi:ABC-type multidrug transport system ATPase subunit
MEPIICPPGKYCPTPVELLDCPEGYFCPTGTFEPIRCDVISHCPQGSRKQKSYIGITIFGCIDFLILLVFVYRFFYERRRVANQFKSKGFSNETKLQLAQNFQRSMNGAQVQMNFRMEALGLTLNTGKTILQGVDGHIQSGRLTAVLGPSGAGKTTFMNVLCGKVARTSGKLWISGQELELSRYRKIVGFVPQDDIMYRELTVRENILHSARIRLPRNWTEAEVQRHVDLVLEALDLVHVQHTLIGDGITRGISGGQRKRVNIALEIASCPLTLCLDEPTSGLDSTAALEVADMLKRMADLGMTVVAVIHQPRVEIFKKFDEVLLLAPGGRTAYLGPTIGARPYFERLGYAFPDGANEADVLMDILSGAGVNLNREYTVQDLVELWDSQGFDMEAEQARKASIPFSIGSDETNVMEEAIITIVEAVAMEEPILLQERKLSTASTEIDQQFHDLSDRLVAERGASFLKQLWLTHNLSLLQQYRAFNGLALEVIVGMLAGFLMGISASNFDELYRGMMKAPFTLLSPAPVYWMTVQYNMMVMLAVALAASPAGSRVFSEELEVYWRYAASGHSPTAYYLGKTISTFYRIGLASLHFSALLYFLSSPVIPFTIQFAVILFCFFGVYGLSAFVSMVVRRENATLLAVVIALFSGVFSGYGLTIQDAKDWGLYFIWCGQFNMWGAQAYFSETLRVYEHIYDNSMANVGFGYTLNQPGLDFVYMMTVGLVWRIVAYIAMLYCNRDKQK